MKYKLSFKGLDEQLNISNLTDDLILDMVQEVWNKDYRKQFENEQSFVETEYSFSKNSDSTWSYSFWIGDMRFTKQDMVWVEETLLDFIGDLKLHFHSKGLRIQIKEDGIFPEGAGYHGRGFIKVIITFVELDSLGEKILDYYNKEWEVTSYGTNGNIFYIEYDSNYAGASYRYRVIIDVDTKQISKYLVVGAAAPIATFLKSELKFFDMLGFELYPAFAAKVGQDITDWWSMK